MVDRLWTTLVFQMLINQNDSQLSVETSRVCSLLSQSDKRKFSWHRIIGDVLGGVCFCSQGCLLCCLSGYVVVCQFQSGQCNRQFHFVTQSKTWTEAQLYCREKYTDLATFTSKDETMAAQRLVGSQKFWIGLFRVWKWSYTGTGKSTFTNWGTGEPGVGKCVTVSALGFWSTRECSEGKHFICYSGEWHRHLKAPRRRNNSLSDR